jgi:hypothetical protein
MPTTIFDWIIRTAMLAMAGLVTLSILGAIAAMTNDTGARFAAPGERPPVEGEPSREREAAQAPSPPETENAAGAPRAEGQAATSAAMPAASRDRQERWLEAIAYGLLALAGIGALAVLMLWNVARELRRIGRAQP